MYFFLTLVYQNLKRSKSEIYFYRGKKECDFILKNGTAITKAIQVTCSLTDADTRQRELDGLLEAMQAYNLQQGLILTLDTSAEYQLHNLHIIVKPVWEWLLN